LYFLRDTFFGFKNHSLMNALIVGFGSYHADDQIGWMVVDQLQSLDTISSTVSFLKIAGNAMAWLSLVEVDTQLIFIDAVLSEKAPGFIHHQEFTTDLPLTPSSFSSHGLGLVESLKLAQSLNLLNKPSIFYGIEIDTVAPLGSFSQDVLKAIPEVVTQVENYLLSDI